MKHPLIKEIQLGKSVEEVIEEHFSEYEFQRGEAQDRLPEIVREIIRINNKWTKFAVKVMSDECHIVILNAASDLMLNYWDDEYSMADDDNAHEDCETLNEIVERLYGIKRKKPKPKLTKEQFIAKKGNACPYCGRKAEILDGVTWTDRDFMGCPGCGETWEARYERVFTGFSPD